VTDRLPTNPLLGVVAALCCYEVGASFFNRILGESVVPSVVNGFGGFRWAAFGSHLVPRRSAKVAFVAAASLGHALAASRAHAGDDRARASSAGPPVASRL
jgi:hypothetical protein